MDPDVAEVLERIQHQALPDAGAQARFEGRVRRWERRRRASAIALVIAITGSAAAAVTRSLRSTSPQPADTPTVVRLRPGAVSFEVPVGWTVREGPGQLTFVRDLPSGGQIEVFAWHLSDERLRPIDPTSGEVGPAGAPISWFDRFAEREQDLPAYSSPQGNGFVSPWASDDAMPLLWLLSQPGVDLATVERTDYRIDEHFAPRTAFDLAASADAFEVIGGERIRLPEGRIWAWYSPMSDLDTIIGYRIATDADAAEAGALASELFRGIALPAP